MNRNWSTMQKQQWWKLLPIFQLKQFLLYTSPCDLHLNYHFKSIKWTNTWSHIWISKFVLPEPGVRCTAASTLSQGFVLTASPGKVQSHGLRAACWERAEAKNLWGTSLGPPCLHSQDACQLRPSSFACWFPALHLADPNLLAWLPGLALGCYGGHGSLGHPWSSSRRHTTLLVGVVGLCPCWCRMVLPVSLSLWSCLLACCLIPVFKTDLVLHAPEQSGVDFLFLTVKDMKN